MKIRFDTHKRFVTPALIAGIGFQCFASAQDINQLICSVRNADYKNEILRRDYTYDRLERDTNSKPKKLAEVSYISGEFYLKLKEKDGARLAPGESAKEEQRFKVAQKDVGNFSKESESLENRAKLLASVSQAFEYKIVGEESVNGRPTWRVRATPKQDYRGAYDFLLHSLQGTIWIDEEDSQWAKAEAEALDTISLTRYFGFFVTAPRGTKTRVENIKVENQVWEPKYASYLTPCPSVLGLFPLSVSVCQRFEFSNYHKIYDLAREIPQDLPCK